MALLAVTDLLVDGPFVAAMKDLSRPWVGSSNQRYHFLTTRYRHLKTALDSIPNRMEMWLLPDGRLEISGMYDTGELRWVLDSLDVGGAPRSAPADA